MSLTIQNIEVIMDDYKRETGKTPAGLILGPGEYVELCEYMARTESYMKDARVNSFLVTEYLGVSVFTKELPGIDILISYQDALRYAGVE